MEWLILAVLFVVKGLTALALWLLVGMLVGWVMDALDLPLQAHHTTSEGTFDHRGRRVIVFPAWVNLLMTLLFAPSIILVFLIMSSKGFQMEVPC